MPKDYNMQKGAKSFFAEFKKVSVGVKEKVICGNVDNQVIDRVRIYVYKIYTYEDECQKYFDEYLLPLLENSKDIKFDNTSKKFIKLKEKALQLVKCNVSMGTSIEFMKLENFRDTYGDIDFLYNDDKEIKERVAKSLYDELLKK